MFFINTNISAWLSVAQAGNHPGHRSFSLTRPALRPVTHKAPSVPPPPVSCPPHCRHLVHPATLTWAFSRLLWLHSDSFSTYDPERCFRNSSHVRSPLCLWPFNDIPLGLGESLNSQKGPHGLCVAGSCQHVHPHLSRPPSFFKLHSPLTILLPELSLLKTSALCWGDSSPISQEYLRERRWKWRSSMERLCAFRKWQPSRQMQPLAWDRLDLSLRLQGRGPLDRTRPAQPERWPWLKMSVGLPPK